MINYTRIAILAAISNLAWFICSYTWNQSRVATLEGESLARAWGIYLLVLMLGFLLLNVLITALVMGRQKAGGGKGFAEKSDERDCLIEGVAMKTFGIVITISLLLSAALLALGLGLQVFFRALSFTLLLADLGLWISYAVAYGEGR
ncbi:MAG: hypothetical protein QM270_02630 [Bacillota bacterium]|nr:hypothetical protein [Bacillota bacterium]